MSAKVSNKFYVEAFFKLADDGKHHCNLCPPSSQPIIQKKGSGYTNLMNHLEARHEHFNLIYQQRIENVSSAVNSATSNYSTSVLNIFNWVSLIVKCKLPLNVCENSDFVKHTSLSKLDISTVGKYISRLADTVRERAKNILPEKIGIMFDGWTSNGIHFVGLFGIYYTIHKARNLVLLAFSPFEDRTTQNADAHIGFFKDVLDLYSKSVKNVLFLSGDNCNTNRKIASDLDLPLVGCASHRLNLAVNDLINSSSTLVNQIRTIVHMMRTYKNRGKLAKVTSLIPILDNATRWMSVMKMIKRCKELVPYITQANGFLGKILFIYIFYFIYLFIYYLFLYIGREILLVEQLNFNEVNCFIKRLNYFSEATNDLQNESINLDDVRAYFDLLIEECPELESRLGKNAQIIHDSVFEEAVIKVLRKHEAILKSDERQKLQEFIVNQPIIDEGPMTMKERVVKKRKLEESKYMNMNIIPPTSNAVERLFSLVKYYYTDWRKSLDPHTLENLLLLRMNDKMWSIQDIHHIKQ
jgi:hypothetical protein